MVKFNGEMLPNRKNAVKYFFLSDGWTYSRVWELGGIWDELVWRRPPHILRLNLGIVEQQENLWLYQVEDDVLMVEVKPSSEPSKSASAIGQVFLKRLMSAEQVIERLAKAEGLISLSNAPPSS